MDINLDQLRSVLVLGQRLHLGRAATTLHVSQPALTKQIRKIEETLGGPLFVRKPREVTLTRAGEVLVERARSLLQEAQHAWDNVSRFPVPRILDFPEAHFLGALHAATSGLLVIRQ